MNPIVGTHTKKDMSAAKEREQEDTMGQKTNRNSSQDPDTPMLGDQSEKESNSHLGKLEMSSTYFVESLTYSILWKPQTYQSSSMILRKCLKKINQIGSQPVMMKQNHLLIERFGNWLIYPQTIRLFNADGSLHKVQWTQESPLGRIFSTMAQFETMQILLALAALEDWYYTSSHSM